MTIHLEQISISTSAASIRSHRVLIDRPLDKGGADRGPMGGELFLASVGGCFLSNLLAAIAAREAKISNCRIEVTGTLAAGPARFEAIALRISADTSDGELLNHLVEIADRGCIMMNTLRSTLSVTISAGPASE